MVAVFVSYSHKRGPWVKDRLVPVLRAGGAEVLVDWERFNAGTAVVGQMDREQDRAEVHLLCLSTEYLASDYCRHEMQRAIAGDPDFKRGLVVPIRLDDAPLPPAIAGPAPLWVDMRDDSKPEPWQLVLQRCGACIGTSAPDWLAARDQTVRLLERGQSVHIRIGRRKINWRLFFNAVAGKLDFELPCVSLEEPRTIYRSGLLNHILERLGTQLRVRNEPKDLEDFERFISNMPHPVILALGEFDIVLERKRRYGNDFFHTLKYMVIDNASLQLLIHSRIPFASLVPTDHPLSYVVLQTVSLE